MFRKTIGITISFLFTLGTWFFKEAIKAWFFDKVIHIDMETLPKQFWPFLVEYGPPTVFAMLTLWLLIKDKNYIKSLFSRDPQKYSLEWWKSKEGMKIEHPDDLNMLDYSKFIVLLKVKKKDGEKIKGHMSSRGSGQGFRYQFQNREGYGINVRNEEIDKVTVIKVEERQSH